MNYGTIVEMTLTWKPAMPRAMAIFHESLSPSTLTAEAWVQALVRDLRSHKQCSAAKKNQVTQREWRFEAHQLGDRLTDKGRSSLNYIFELYF